MSGSPKLEAGSVTNSTSEPDVFDEMDDDSGTFTKFDITSYGADYTVDGLVKRMESGAFYTPDWQRSFVWSLKQSSRFVESLLLGLPVPGIFVYKEDLTGKHLIIDGQQRLKSLQMFYSGLFLEKKFRLTEINERWSGKSVSELSAPDKQRLDDATIHITIFKQDQPSKDKSSIYQVFKRLNTGATKLTEQEIRNCLYDGKFTELLRELNDLKEWRDIFGDYNKRLKDHEMILRFLAIYYRINEYKRPMTSFLNGYIEDNKDISELYVNECRTLFHSTIECCRQSFGERAFRPEKQLNAAVFDAVMFGIARRLKQGAVTDFADLGGRYSKLIADPEFRKSYTKATADEESVKARTSAAESAFASVK